MTPCVRGFLACGLAAVAGCGSGSGTGKPPEPTAGSVRAEEIVGKWRLVRAGGKSPDELNIKSQEIDIAADGTWTSKILFQIPGFGQPDTFTGKGKWSLAGDGINYEYSPAGGLAVAGSGPNSGKSQVRLEAGRLVVDPDFFMQVRKPGAPPVAGEYERAGG